MDNSSQPGLALDDAIRHSHLLAECWEVDDEFDRVDIVSNDDELGLLVLDERDDVVEPELDSLWLGGLLWGGSVLGGLGDLGESLLLLSTGLRSVGVEEFEELGGGILVQGVLELGKCRWDLEPLVEDLLLTLKLDVFRPFHEPREVLLWLHILSDTKVSGSLLNERVLWSLL